MVTTEELREIERLNLSNKIQEKLLSSINSLTELYELVLMTNNYTEPFFVETKYWEHLEFLTLSLMQKIEIVK